MLGGGLAGLATASCLAEAGFEVDIYEAKAFLGGRATSWPMAGVPGEQDSDEAELVDNCQHVLLRCCVNLIDFYRRLGVSDKIVYHKQFSFIEPGGRISSMRRGIFPAPAHFAESFLGLKFVNFREKLAIGRAMNSIPSEWRKRKDLDRITMLDWLREERQPEAAIQRFWYPVLVSAVNEELDQMAASHGLQVFWLGMLARSDSYEMGLPAVPLRELYDAGALGDRVRIHYRTPVTAIQIGDGGIVSVECGERVHADYFVSCLPFERVEKLLPALPVEWGAFAHSPITGIHLWFDRPVTNLPHAALLDRTIQWMFNKRGGRYIQLVVSASRTLSEMPRQAVIDLALRELAEFLPATQLAKLERAHVVKEIRATFSAKPGLEALRPVSTTSFPNFFLAGDWTRTGWPATMEGAVRSGYLAAEAVARAARVPRSFLIPDIA